jgi:hypothetical protein
MTPDTLSPEPFCLEQEPFDWQSTQVCWTDADLDALYEGLMFRSLQQLFSAHSSIELRCDVNSWIFDDPLLGPKGAPRAFSFEATCCWLRVDPVEVRCQVLDLMIRTGITDLIDENRMAVADKRRNKSAASSPSVLQLGFFEADDAVFAPMGLTLPKVRRPHERRDFEAFIGVMQQSLF